MIAELRRMANEAAQAALRDMLDYMLRTGHRSPVLEAQYVAAERLLDMVDETYQRMQSVDPEAPDYFPLTDPGDHFAYPQDAA